MFSARSSAFQRMSNISNRHAWSKVLVHVTNAAHYGGGQVGPLTLAHAPSHLTERATRAHPLHPAALASVPYGIVLVRVRVRAKNRFLASSRHVAPGPAMTTPTTQRAWRALQVHHKDGPVRDASSKGGVEGAYLGPRLPAARAPAWDVPRTTHAREQQEAHLRAPASLRLDPPCPRRARIDQNNRAWRTWSLLWGTEVRKSSCKTWMRRYKSNRNESQATKCARVPSAAFLVAISRPCAPARARKTRAALRAAHLARALQSP